MTDPLELLHRTYQLCRRFTSSRHDLPRRAVLGIRIVRCEECRASSRRARGVGEFHPTYRGAIDGLRYAGFREVIEIVATEETTTGLYRNGGRRCFLAMK